MRWIPRWKFCRIIRILVEAILEEGEVEVDAVILQIMILWLAIGAGVHGHLARDSPQTGALS